MRTVESPNQDDRPPNTEITLVVLHAISLPPGEYGGDSIERLFTNRSTRMRIPISRRFAASRSRPIS